MPADFFAVIKYRIYLDYTEEMMAYYSSVVQPSGYIIHSPIEFSKWVEWAQRQEPGKTELKMSFGLGKTELSRTMDDFLGRM